MISNYSNRSRVRPFAAILGAAVIGTGIFLAASQGSATAATVKQGCAKFVDDKGFAFFFANDTAVKDLNGTRCSAEQIKAAEDLLDLDAPGKAGSGKATLTASSDFNKGGEPRDEEEAEDIEATEEDDATEDNSNVKQGCAKFEDDNGFAFFFANDAAVEDLDGTRCSSVQIKAAEDLLDLDAPGKAGSGKATLTEDSEFNKAEEEAVVEEEEEVVDQDLLEQCALFEDDNGFAFFFADTDAIDALDGIRCTQAQIDAAEIESGEVAPGKAGKGKATLTETSDFFPGNDDEEDNE